MSDTIPIINIVSDKEEDDDSHVSTIGEALTDVEDLEETTGQSKRHKPKLMIRLNDGMGDNTDVEDIEGSDLDETPVIISHKHRVPSTDLSLDIGTVEEVCKLNDKIDNTNAKLSSQKSLTPIIEKPISSFTEEAIITDTENWSVNETDSDSDIGDIEIDPKIYEYADSMKTKDTMKYSLVSTPSPCATPFQCLSDTESTNKRSKRTIENLSAKRLCASMFQISNVTDVEVLESDVNDDEQLTRKTKRIKRRRSKNQAKLENQLNPNYFNSRSQNHQYCKIESYVKHEGTTDVEEFDTDTNVTTEYVYDNSAINKEIEKLQHFYGPTKEKHIYKRRNGKICKSYDKKSDDESDNDRKGHVKHRHVKNQNKHQLGGCKYSLPLPKTDENCLTDVESVVSSDEDIPKISQRTQRCTSGNVTEEEVVLDTYDYLGNLLEIKLPDAKREIVFLKENDVSTPTVTIAPLDEEFPLGLNVTPDQITDTENISGADVTDDDDNEVEITEISNSVLDDLDNDTTEEREFFRGSKSNQSLHVPVDKVDNTTDTEEVVVNVENKTKSKLITLVVENAERAELTDTEDLYFSDGGKIIGKSSLKAKIDNEDKIETSRKRLYKNKVRIANIKADEVMSDSDDIASSNEGEFHFEHTTPKNHHGLAIESVRELNSDGSEEVMHLRGGGYSQIATDMEYISLLEGKSKVVENLYASNYESNVTIPQSLHINMFTTRSGYATNFNINYEPVQLNSLSMFYVSYCYIVTVPYIETSVYHFGASDSGDVDKPKRFFARQSNKKLPDSIARLVTKFESFSSNQESRDKHQKGDHHERDRIVNIRTNFNVNRGGSFFLRRNLVNAGNSSTNWFSFFLYILF